MEGGITINRFSLKIIGTARDSIEIRHYLLLTFASLPQSIILQSII